ncbi:MAG: iron-containing alcohol dehydrogenase [Paracoccaceae bacterium]|jgi:alcohol dehydrogenase class IV|nr:iron-containing alcohol dehydrogenase [Paracoccaceae bacterium]MDG1675613.1 iron-containing alcohol dehydrogenase [Paracoccaceae bacterium]MDG2248612.1 iron-containing alcohol dehydrogenase [Paracoccaceae bacterium]
MLPAIKIDEHFLNDSIDWEFPIPIAYGPGRLNDIAEFCKKSEISKPLIITDKGSKELPFISRLAGLLESASIQNNLFYGISPNPRDDEINAGCNAYRRGNHDGIIAIGGGSALDGAKAIGMTVNSGVNLWDFEYRKPDPILNSLDCFPNFITIPTTAGTGAETESTAMITDTVQGMKFCLAHLGMRPSLAILDPELTVGLPANLTAWTGVDALTHALEAYLVPGLNPLCDGAALEGLKLISKWLKVAFDEPKNISARGGMLIGSCLAGVAFTKGLGLVHSISHMIGAEYNTQHGLTNAIILPAVMKFNLPYVGDKVRSISHAMDLKEASSDMIVQEIEQILDYVNIPRSLTEIGIPLECKKRIAKKAMLDSATATNPRLAQIEDVEELTEISILAARG